MRGARDRERGYLVLTVVLALVMVGLMASQLGLRGGVQRAVSGGAMGAEAALFVAEAGLEHATWLVQNGHCAPGPLLTSQPFGPHSYDVIVGTVSDGLAPLTAVGTLAGGLARQRTRSVPTGTLDTETLVLFPVADVYIHTDDHNDGVKLDYHVTLDPGAPKTENALVRFELPDLGAWNVDSAVFEATVFAYNKENDPLPSGPIDIAVHRVTQGWLEGDGGDCPCTGAIWTSYDGDPLNLWITPGGDYDPTPTDVQTVFNAQTVSWQIRSLVENWADGTHPNQGLLMRVEAGFPDQVKLRSREWTNPAELPRLVLDVSCPCGVECRRSYLDRIDQRTCNPALDYAGSDGAFTRDWTLQPWVEGFDDGSSCAGDIRIEPDLGDNSLYLSGAGALIERQADTSMLTTARLSFAYRMVAVTGPRYLHLEASGDGGASWTPLDSYFGAGTDLGYRHVEYDLTPFLAMNTRIRFVTDALVGAGTPHFLVDDVQIDELPVSPSPAAPVVFPVAMDSFLDENKPNNEFGDDDEIEILEEAGARRRAVLDFDLSAIPPGTPIANATLRLWVTSNRTDNAGSQIRLHELLEGWGELDVNWNDRQLATPWGTPGGERVLAPLADEFIAKDHEDAWIEFDVTPLAQAWVDGVSDHGVLVETNRNKEILFATRESGDPAPELVVTLP